MQVDGLILEVPGGAIIPVRAIPFVTGRVFTPRSIAAAIADGREEPDGRQYETDLHAGYVDAMGSLLPTAPAELVPFAKDVERLFREGAAHIDQIAAMPAGVYLPIAELESIVDETNALCGGPGGDGLVAVTIRRKPMVSPTVRALVLQGFEVLMRGSHRRQSKALAVRGRRQSIEGEEEDRNAVAGIVLLERAARPGTSNVRMLNLRQLDRYIHDWTRHRVHQWIKAAEKRKPDRKPGRRWPNHAKQ